jgi:hypothetical protein
MSTKPADTKPAETKPAPTQAPTTTTTTQPTQQQAQPQPTQQQAQPQPVQQTQPQVQANTGNKIKVRFIKKRLNPVSKEVFEKVHFDDSPEEAEKRRKEEAERQRIDKEKADAAAKAAADKAAADKAAADKAAADKAAADKAAADKAAAANKSAADKAAADKAAADKAAADKAAAEKKAAEEKKEAPSPTKTSEPVLTSSYKPPVYKADASLKIPDSTFAKFHFPGPEDYQTMLEHDIKNSSLAKFFPTPEDLEKSKKFLLDNYYYFRLVHIHRYYQAQSNFPDVGYNDVMNMLKETKTMDKEFDASKLALVYAEANASGAKKSGDNDKDLSRCEFMELIVRIAIHKYKKSGKVQRHREALRNKLTPFFNSLDKYLENDFLPFAKSSEAEYTGFRTEKIMTVAVNKVLAAAKDKIDKLFLKVGGQDGSLDIKEVTKMIREAKLTQVSNREAIWCFCMAQQPVIDGKASDYAKMDKREFREFLCRVALKQYEGKKDPLDKMLSDLLNILCK